MVIGWRNAKVNQFPQATKNLDKPGIFVSGRQSTASAVYTPFIPKFKLPFKF